MEFEARRSWVKHVPSSDLKVDAIPSIPKSLVLSHAVRMIIPHSYLAYLIMSFPLPSPAPLFKAVKGVMMHLACPEFLDADICSTLPPLPSWSNLLSTVPSSPSPELTRTLIRALSPVLPLLLLRVLLSSYVSRSLKSHSARFESNVRYRSSVMILVVSLISLVSMSVYKLLPLSNPSDILYNQWTKSTACWTLGLLISICLPVKTCTVKSIPRDRVGILRMLPGGDEWYDRYGHGRDEGEGTTEDDVEAVAPLGVFRCLIAALPAVALLTTPPPSLSLSLLLLTLTLTSLRSRPTPQAALPPATSVHGDPDSGGLSITDLYSAHKSGPWGTYGLDLTASPGEVICVTGAEGAGKTSLCKVLLGDDSIGVVRGDISVFGVDKNKWDSGMYKSSVKGVLVGGAFVRLATGYSA